MAKQPQFTVGQSFDFWEAKNKITKTLEAVDISGSTKEHVEEKRAESSMSKTGTRKRSGPSRHLAELKNVLWWMTYKTHLKSVLSQESRK